MPLRLLENLDDRANAAMFLRTCAMESQTVVEMVESLQKRIGDNRLHTLELVAAFREAFCLKLIDISPLSPWYSSPQRKECDDDLNRRVLPRIIANRHLWESLPRSA